VQKQSNPRWNVLASENLVDSAKSFSQNNFRRFKAPRHLPTLRSAG